MLSSRFAGIPISSSIIDGSGVPQLLNRGEQTLRAVTGSGGRLHFGMVAGLKSERWQTSNRNPRPDCVGIRNLAMPSRAPELNPVENIWQYLRANWLSNRVFETFADIIDAICEAWNKLIAQPETITSIGMRDWAHVSQTP